MTTMHPTRATNFPVQLVKADFQTHLLSKWPDMTIPVGCTR
jgi:hypothetical protein